ncbi:MAG: hypothetical protein PVG12_05525, partial [Gammaproteobacteria bacterium]
MNLDINWLVGLHIPSGLLPGILLWTGNLMFLLCLLVAIRQAPWKVLLEKQENQHVFLGAVVILLSIWGIKAGISPG